MFESSTTPNASGSMALYGVKKLEVKGSSLLAVSIISFLFVISQHLGINKW
jgi:hypothetical protein